MESYHPLAHQKLGLLTAQPTTDYDVACRCIVESVGLGFDPETCNSGHVDADCMYIVQVHELTLCSFRTRLLTARKLRALHTHLPPPSGACKSMASEALFLAQEFMTHGSLKLKILEQMISPDEVRSPVGHEAPFVWRNNLTCDRRRCSCLSRLSEVSN